MKTDLGIAWSALVLILGFPLVNACQKGDKALGVCLHVYLERDFLSLERIVYPTKKRINYLYKDDQTLPNRLSRSTITSNEANRGAHSFLKKYNDEDRDLPPDSVGDLVTLVEVDNNESFNSNTIIDKFDSPISPYSQSTLFSVKSTAAPESKSTLAQTDIQNLFINSTIQNVYNNPSQQGSTPSLTESSPTGIPHNKNRHKQSSEFNSLLNNREISKVKDDHFAFENYAESKDTNDVSNNRTGKEIKKFTHWKRRIKRNSYGRGNYGERDWIEGPELEDHCRRLEEVVECFEQVLIDCDSGIEFFRYRHLLHALRYAHKYLCYTPDFRRNRFLGFLKTIECAEDARTKSHTCLRNNVSLNVWNQILRAEVGEEICPSLSTQRSCLLEHNYIKLYCRDAERVQIYTDLSSLFLSIWCKLPLTPKLAEFYDFSSSPGEHYGNPLVILFLVMFWTLLWCQLW